MKRILSFFMCVFIAGSLCSCKKIDFSDYSSIVQTIEEKAESIIAEKFDINDITVENPPVYQSENELMLNDADNKIWTLNPATVSANENLCYNCLTKEQRRIYCILLTAANKMTTGWISLGNCKSTYQTDVSVAYRAVMSDYPDLFWLPSSYFLGNRGKPYSDILIAFCYHNDGGNCDYIIKKDDKNKMKTELETVVSSIADGAKDFDSVYEKELYIHDRICEITSYEVSSDPLIYTAYGALVSGKAVCEGYSRALQLICSKIRIPCVLVYGDAQGEGHMWNVINVDGDWYHLDVTWDDSKSEIYHTYFNVCDSEILESHTEYNTYIPQIDKTFPKEEKYNLLSYICDSTKFNYFTYNNAFLDRSCVSTADTIRSEYLKGKNYTQLKVTDTALLSELNILYTPYLAKLQLKLNKLFGNNILLKSISITNNIVTLCW